jgi:hypothetical protein
MRYTANSAGSNARVSSLRATVLTKHVSVNEERYDV